MISGGKWNACLMFATCASFINLRGEIFMSTFEKRWLDASREWPKRILFTPIGSSSTESRPRWMHSLTRYLNWSFAESDSSNDIWSFRLNSFLPGRTRISWSEISMSRLSKLETSNEMKPALRETGNGRWNDAAVESDKRRSEPVENSSDLTSGSRALIKYATSPEISFSSAFTTLRVVWTFSLQKIAWYSASKTIDLNVWMKSVSEYPTCTSLTPKSGFTVRFSTISEASRPIMVWMA